VVCGLFAALTCQLVLPALVQETKGRAFGAAALLLKEKKPHSRRRPKVLAKILKMPRKENTQGIL